MFAKPIYENVPGAPFGIGLEVKVTSLTDESADRRFLGKMGRIDYYEYSCGCGQSYPKDPMIGVRFRSGETEEFWREELTAVVRRVGAM